MPDTQDSSNIIYSKVMQGGKDKNIGFKITNLNDLKKATPRLKFPTILSSSASNKIPKVSKEMQQKLDNYCRTCAGLKVPLIDIYSEKGIQMRLEQQLQHLEIVKKDESLSTKMCMDCICDLKMSYKFFMQIKKAEMKLKTMSQNFSDTSLKPQVATEPSPSPSIDEIKAEPLLESSTSKIAIDSNKDVKSEPGDFEYSYFNEFTNDGHESFEEFDPDDTDDVNENIEKNTISESSTIETTDGEKKVAYTYDKTLNAYVKVNIDKESNLSPIEHIDVDKVEMNLTKTSSVDEDNSKKPIVKPSPSKRKLSVRDESDDSTSHTSKKSTQKVNIGIKDLKIPKLDLENSTNIKKIEDGVMYVTTKGTKPNEMLLIKVKKMRKPSDKKGEKIIIKRKLETNMECFKRYDTENERGKEIDKQIEEYKKRRSQILGDGTKAVKKTSEVANVEARTASDNSSTEDKQNSQEDLRSDEKVTEEQTLENKDIISISDDSNDSQRHQSKEKSKHKWKDLKQRHITIFDNLAEDHTDRLKAVLKQSDEDIEKFKNYLKTRKIVVSRLRDIDIITLYEQKNNVVLEREIVEVPVIEEEELVEEIDPFEFVESYECDFCDESFDNREDMFEHSKVHDFKLMHYCEDCCQEFFTHKAKRCHNVTCVQKLMCKYCDMILESKGKKRQHEQKHCDDQNGQLCDLCGEKFKHQGTLDQHVKARHMNLEKIFKCPQCPKRFAFRTKLTFHLKSVHTNNRPYLCEDCGCSFKNPANLRHHRIRKHAPVDNKKECHVCSKLVPVYGMSKHMHTHKSYSIQCPHCEKMFKNTSTLKQHLRIHEDQRQYKCDMCGVGFNRRDGLRLHLRVHEKPDSKGLKECVCQVCNEKFPSHSMLVIHRNRTHKDGRNYTCHICNRSMISTRSLEWHMAHIHNEAVPGLPKDASSVDVETKRVACVHCDKTFKTEMILRTHIKNTHTQKEPMKCLDCDDMFMSEVRWKHHMMTVHNRLDGTLECPHCPKRFVNQLRLKTHMISHSDERPHTCDICGFMLKTKVQLIKHKQNRHSNERPLQCKFCNWRCKQVSALVCHERTHTNERPYQCSVCKQKFKYLGDKNKHERRHEVLGGTGFKRIVTGRNTSTKVLKRRSELLSGGTNPVGDEGEDSLGLEDRNTFADNSFDDSNMMKFEDGEIVTEESQASYEHIYVSSQEVDEPPKVVVGMDETTVYTEEVTADEQIITSEMISGDVIASDMIDESMLQPGTVFHLERKDDNGQIQVIPVILAPTTYMDSEAQNSEVDLATASIM